ncbi:MAG: hypothetical protein JO031_09335 [Ktedonobacteraceae bacterium]|nr:hypothetical protein [Ktedonobacteraceae bacterium]
MRTNISYSAIRVLLWLVLVGGIFSLGACGSVPQSGTSSSNTPQTKSSATATATSRITPAPTPTTPIAPTPTRTATPEGVMSNQVKVTTDKLQYATNETVTIIVSNGLSHNIFISPYQTNCTPILLEKQGGTTWMPQNPCYRVQAAALLQLRAESVTMYQLAPAFRPYPGGGSGISKIFLPPSIQHSWQPGTYRASISYTLQPDPDTIQGGTRVYSSVISVT